MHEDKISIDARIIGIVDAFDAMTSTRPYRQGMSIDIVLTKMRQERGQQFDGALLDYFIELGQSGEVKHIVGHSDVGTAMVNCPKCGPVITVARNSRDGDVAYCKPCRAEFRLHRHDDSFVAELKSHTVNVDQLKPEADIGPIDDIVKQAPKNLVV